MGCYCPQSLLKAKYTYDFETVNPIFFSNHQQLISIKTSCLYFETQSLIVVKVNYVHRKNSGQVKCTTHVFKSR